MDTRDSEAVPPGPNFPELTFYVVDQGKNVGMSQDQEAPSVGPVFDQCRARYGTFTECPLCGNGLIPEHAHYKCTTCGWRDSCCD